MREVFLITTPPTSPKGDTTYRVAVNVYFNEIWEFAREFTNRTSAILYARELASDIDAPIVKIGNLWAEATK